MNILRFLLIYVPMHTGTCLSVEGTALPKLKIDGSFINAKVNIRQSNYYIRKSCKEYLSTEEHISNNLTWLHHENIKKLKKGEMHFSHSTMLEPLNLGSPVIQIRGGTREHSSIFPLGELPFCFHRNPGTGAGTVWLHVGDNLSENWSWIHMPSPRRLKAFNQHGHSQKKKADPKFFF